MRGPLAGGELRELQLVELGILREFVRLCEAHGLRYYLAYGTLLGAVRHSGFIPWDDDLDVTMPRDDYNRFTRACVSGLRPGFTWQTYGTSTHYPYSFGKLMKTDTVLRQAPSAHLPIQHSVHIDVFPLDGFADGRVQALLQRLVLVICRSRLGVGIRRTPLRRLGAQFVSLISSVGVHARHPDRREQSLIDAFGKAVTMLFEDLMVALTRVVPRSVVISMIEAMSRRYPPRGARRWICAGGAYGCRRQSFPSSWFGMGVPLRFEDLTVVGPAHWHAYLDQLYGDYMTPPPPRRRASHHACTEFSLEPGVEAR